MRSLVDKFFESAPVGVIRYSETWTFLPSVDVALLITEAKTAIGDEIKTRENISIKLWEALRTALEGSCGEVVVVAKESFSKEIDKVLMKRWGTRGIKFRRKTHGLALEEFRTWLREQGGAVAVQWGQVRLAGNPGSQIIVRGRPGS